MIFKSILEMANFINEKHNRFNGHVIVNDCANSRTYDTLCRAYDFLKKESAAVSVTFEASIDVCGKAVQTLITVSNCESGYRYAEKTTKPMEGRGSMTLKELLSTIGNKYDDIRIRQRMEGITTETSIDPKEVLEGAEETFLQREVYIMLTRGRTLIITLKD